MAKPPASSIFAHYSRLTIDDPPTPVRLSSIICTIGPASREVNKLIELADAGMNIARLNFSHGTHEYHLGTIKNVREAERQINERIKPDQIHIAIALDTKGPEIRTGLVSGSATAEMTLKKGDKITVTTQDEFKEKCSPEKLWVDYKNITKVVKEGMSIYIDDGLLSLRADKIGTDSIECTVENGGKVGSKKGVNLPGALVDLPAVSEKDKEDLRFGIENNVDMIFASFIRNASGVREMRQVLGEAGKNIMIMSKVENQEGCQKIDEIIDESDGVMVARGDLGIEIPTEKIFVAQKMMITKCNMVGKPVICATQMLESMTYKPRPTRAESSDVANAILDGADCVMLSGESAKGEYPVIAVRTMSAIVAQAEAVFYQKDIFNFLADLIPYPGDTTHSTALATAVAAVRCRPAAIIALTETGRIAHLISRYRPPCVIMAVCRNKRVLRQTHLFRGIFPLYLDSDPGTDWAVEIERRVEFAIQIGKKRNYLKAADCVIVVTGWKKGSGSTNAMRFIYVPGNL